MNPDQLPSALARLETAVADAARPDASPMIKVAQGVAANVRSVASRDGNQIGVRVRATAAGVRVTVTGPRASRYRAMMRQALERQIPLALVEVKAQAARRH